MSLFRKVFYRLWIVPDHNVEGTQKLLRNFRVRAVKFAYLLIPFALTERVNASQRLDVPGAIDLVAVAFNNVETIHQQIRLLRKYLADPFVYTVFDNSSFEAARRQIRALCEAERVPYVALPKNPFVNPSKNHGLALTWAYLHYLKPRGAPLFGTLDHDIFPTRRVSLLEKVSHCGLYGLCQIRGDRWYLWPGFSFFLRTLVGDRHLDFMPVAGLDTGGGNWKFLYSELDLQELPLIRQRLESFKSGTNRQRDSVEYLDEWIHTINASGWKASPGKPDQVALLISKL